MTDPDYVALNMKSTVWQTTVVTRIKQQWNPSYQKVMFQHHQHFEFGALEHVPYFPEDTTYKTLFQQMVSTYHWNLNKIIRTILKKIYRFVLWSPSEGPYFWSWNVHIYQAQTYDF
jgi:hypothetical protein